MAEQWDFAYQGAITMKRRMAMGSLFLASSLSGCANIDFDSNKGGLKYYEPMPYLLYQATRDCKINAQLLMIPTTAKHLKMMSGVFGTSKLNVAMSQGMVASIGQETDSKITETLANLTGLISSAVVVASGKPSTTCIPKVELYRVDANGSLVPTDLSLPAPIPEPG